MEAMRSAGPNRSRELTNDDGGSIYLRADELTTVGRGAELFFRTAWSPGHLSFVRSVPSLFILYGVAMQPDSIVC